MSKSFDELVVERRSDHQALIDGCTGAALSYAELADRVERLASGLASRGFGRGDVLAIWAPNVPDWPVAALAAMRAGGAATGISPACSDAELACQLRDARASLLVTTPELAPRASFREILVTTELPLADPVAPPAPGDVALLPFSSGTTGPPKPVMLTHANLVVAARQAGAALGLSERDVVLAAAPFCHITGFAVVLAAGLAAGAGIVTQERFTPEAFFGRLERHRVTVLVGAPPMLAVLARAPRDLPALELIACGGAPLAPALQRQVAERFPRAVVGQGYGMTETTAIAALPDRHRPTVPGSVGRVARETEIDVTPAGELRVRGPQVMAGYLGREAATAEILAPDGWLRTGDLGHVDAEGDVFVTGRIKELIKVDALQVAPAELEALLLSHPGVADVAVVGRPDARHGEVPVAVVVPAGVLDHAELMRWAAERVAPYKRIRAVVEASAIPRNAGGKILRRELLTPAAT